MLKNISTDQLDALSEIINIGVGRAAGTINDMVGSHVSLRVPSIKVLKGSGIQEDFQIFGGTDLTCSRMSFQGSLVGAAMLIFPVKSASNLVSILTGEQFNSQDLDSMKVETLNEISNIIINSLLGHIGNMVSHRINYAVPQFSEGTIDEVLADEISRDNWVILANTHFSIEKHEVVGNILLFFEADSFEYLLTVIDDQLN